MNWETTTTLPCLPEFHHAATEHTISRAHLPGEGGGRNEGGFPKPDTLPKLCLKVLAGPQPVGMVRLSGYDAMLLTGEAHSHGFGSEVVSCSLPA